MSSRNDNLSCDTRLAQIFADLAAPARRKTAADALACYINADAIFLFLWDSELNVLLPVEGFPQTYPNGRAWHSFFDEAVDHGKAEGELPFPDKDTLKKACSVYVQKMALVALGENTDDARLESLRPLLPLLAIALLNERGAADAISQAALARKSAEQFQAVSRVANAMRLELQKMVSAFRENEKKLARSNQELAQFAFVASHDLQEPMRTIAVFMDLMVEEHSKSFTPAVRQYMDMIKENAVRAQQMIHAFLDLARLDKNPIQHERVNLKEVFQQTLSNLARVIQETDARITHGPLPSIVADHILLREVLQNLISNSIKFRGDLAPAIHLEAARKEEEWLFSLSDNGIGMKENDLQRIFGVFQRLHSREAYPGTGIGLSICKKIIELHGGRIWAESAPGRGTVFFFTIPMK